VSGKKIGSEALTKLQWTTIFDVGLHSLSFPPTHRPTSKIVVHCSFVKASLPLFFPDTQTYVKDCGPLYLREGFTPSLFLTYVCVSGKKRGSEALRKLQWTTIFDVGLCVGEKERE
jgi:hypothetical protein